MGLSRRANALHVVVLSALMMLMALPAGALAASTVAVEGSVLRITGDAANNVITVNLAAGYTVTDTTTATAGAGCTQGTANVVTCPATGITRTDIHGGDGTDRINGASGDDFINGGLGNDFIFGNDGNDTLNSGQRGAGVPGNFGGTLNGGLGFDTATFEDRVGTVTVDLRSGRKTAIDEDGSRTSFDAIEKTVGGMGSDEIIGGSSSEHFNGGPGDAPDTICGALGNDTVDYSDKPVGVTVSLDGVLPSDPDIIASGSNQSNGARQDCRPTQKTGDRNNGQPCVEVGTPASCTTLDRDCTPNDGVPGENDCVGEDIENVIGTPYGDHLTGNDPGEFYGLGPRAEPSGINVLTGGGGDDLLDGSLGPDVFEGGAGNDTASYERRGADDPVAATIDGSANDGSARDLNLFNSHSDQIMGDVEDLVGSAGNDVLKGDGNANVLLGGPGDDLIQGHGGADELGGDAGFDTLEGDQGSDVMNGGPDGDYLFGSVGADSYDGGDGSDTADFSDATIPVSVTLNGAADDGTVGEGDNVQGSIESLIGGLDDDQLNANDGSGTLTGGGGNDLLNGGLGPDTLVGGEGNDTAAYGAHPGPVDVTLATLGGDGMADENDTIAEDVERIGGSDFDDVLSGDAKLNHINGGPGNDRISGAEHDDFLAGDVGNDTINGDVGDDTLDGAEGNDILNGTAGNDTLRGFTGTDILDGGTGADTMSGGDGVDVVSYVSRSADVTVDTLGTPNDGQQGENDQVRTDVESVRTGSGDDNINISDGAVGAATCGGGSDEVTADAGDEIGSGCESGGVSQSAACGPSTSGRLSMTSSGTVSVRMRCSFAAKGSVQLRSVGNVKVGKGKARRINLGKKSFTGKANQVVTVRVKVGKSARRAIQRRKRLRVQATFAVRRSGANASMRTKRTKLTLRASGK